MMIVNEFEKSIDFEMDYLSLMYENPDRRYQQFLWNSAIYSSLPLCCNYLFRSVESAIN